MTTPMVDEPTMMMPMKDRASRAAPMMAPRRRETRSATGPAKGEAMSRPTIIQAMAERTPSTLVDHWVARAGLYWACAKREKPRTK